MREEKPNALKSELVLSVKHETIRIGFRFKRNLYGEKKPDGERNAEREAGREEDADCEQEAKFDFARDSIVFKQERRFLNTTTPNTVFKQYHSNKFESHFLAY